MSKFPSPRLPYGTIARLAAQHSVPLEAAKAFSLQRSGAKKRRIPFMFTLSEWWAWWQVDDRWSRRGRRRGNLVMARRNDAGPFELNNVYPATPAQNLADMDPARRQEARGRAQATLLASGRTLGQNLRVRGDGHPKSKAVITPMGRFGSAALAAEAYGINPGTATRKARTGRGGWRYEKDGTA